ncbi:cytochrome C biogenesis protein CcdA [Vibrio sp. HA2012]|uniref:SPOR domain-containing protein n=1 Tax=Vibrio sp. HA2012 TaxID=1971595 RepID=UPI000C2C2637|nr:SPOR domain-containing protein [Vibrio sp. HA2012]PJC87423.1 cytochrome C biogenesis protein CcdA [Vibrio sp. HA2012]
MKKISILGFTALLAACSSGTYTTDVSSDTYREDYQTSGLAKQQVPQVQNISTVEPPQPQIASAPVAPQQVAVASPAPAPVFVQPAPVRTVQTTPVVTSTKRVKIIPPTQQQIDRNQRFGYTLQVIALDSPYKSRSYADQLPDGPVWEHFKRVNGTDWYAILYGDYATKSEAKAAIQSLPEFFRTRKPFVKSLDEIKNSAYPKLNKLR